MSSIYLSFSPKLTRLFVDYIFCCAAELIAKWISWSGLQSFAKSSKCLQDFTSLFTVKFALIFMSEKPNLLKLCKSNFFVMYKRLLQLFELPKMKDFTIISRYIYVANCIPISRDFCAKEWISIQEKVDSHKASSDLVYCLADQLAALAFRQKNWPASHYMTNQDILLNFVQ